MNTQINKILNIINDIYKNVVYKYIDTQYYKKGINPTDFINYDIDNGFIYKLYILINIIGINNINKIYVNNLIIDIIDDKNIYNNDINIYYLNLLCEQLNITCYKHYIDKKYLDYYIYNNILIKYLTDLFISLISYVLNDKNKFLKITDNKYINIVYKNCLFNNIINISIKDYENVLCDLNNIYINITNFIEIKIKNDNLYNIDKLVTLLQKCSNIINDNCVNIIIKRSYYIYDTDKYNNNNIEANRLNNNKVFNIIYNTFIDSYKKGIKYLPQNNFIYWLFYNNFQHNENILKYSNFIKEFIIYIYNNDYTEYCNFIKNLNNENDILTFVIIFKDIIDESFYYENSSEFYFDKICLEDSNLLKWYKINNKYCKQLNVYETWEYQLWKHNCKKLNDEDNIINIYYKDIIESDNLTTNSYIYIV